MCKKCGGSCCKSTPCQYLPSDFDSLKGIEDEIDTNYAIIDKCELGGEEFYYLRIRNWSEDLTSSGLLLPSDRLYLATKLVVKVDVCIISLLILLFRNKV